MRISTIALTLVAFLLSSPTVNAQPQETQQISNDFRNVAKTAIPAVVSIQVKGPYQSSSFFGEEEEEDSQQGFRDDFWQKFFGLPKKNQKEDQVIGQASGFIVSPDGEIITNSHVVKGMTQINVVLNSGKEYPAKVIGQDPNTDVALIKIDAKDLPFLKLGNSDKLEIGQWVVAIGNPMGLQASLTAGVVSAKGRNNLDLTRIEDYIQTDAAINKGNSGGPLLDMDANVMGMNTAIVTNMASGYMGIGFAIPSNLLKSVVEDLKQDGSFKRGFLGVSLQPVDENLAASFGMERVEGALVAEISKDSPAEKGGIKQGDVIVKYNNQDVSNIGTLRNAISLMKPGTKIMLSIIRNGKPLILQVEIGLFPGSETVASTSATDKKLGIQVANSENGVVVNKVDSNSPLSWSGIKKGALILEINKKKIANVDEFNAALKQSEEGKPILFLIKQGESTRFVSLKMG